MSILIFLIGSLLGLVAGCAVCIRYLRREIAADIGPRLRRIQAHLDNLEAQLNLALISRYVEISERSVGHQALPAPRKQ
jgi:hypothetical protein